VTEFGAVLVVAVLAFLQHRAAERRLVDAYAQIAGLTRQLRAQADPTNFYATEAPAPPAVPQLTTEQFWLTDASGLISVPMERD
jgi:hypothetical protein